jgi:hypothetical protein
LIKEGKIRTYNWRTDFADHAEVFAQGEYCATIQPQRNTLDKYTEGEYENLITPGKTNNAGCMTNIT